MFCSLPFNIINCSNFVTTYLISNVYNNISLTSNSSIVNKKKTDYKLNLILKIINTTSTNVVTIVDNLISLREGNIL